MNTTYGQCPECNYQCCLDSLDKEPNLVGTHSHQKTWTNYGPGENWIEDWKCPECGHEFHETNGYP